MFIKINGSAGYGKTHKLIEDVKTEYKHNKDNILVITPTNKAAAVLNNRFKESGLPQIAKTLHSTIYCWRKTDIIIGFSIEREFDEKTNKFAVNEDGSPKFTKVPEYKWERMVNVEVLNNAVVFVDESSMVQSEVWHDLIESDCAAKIRAYGDEKQLPPIEKFNELNDSVKPYYKFWHKFDQTVLFLNRNHRQSGDLKRMVETIEMSLFAKDSNKSIPVELFYGNNLTMPVWRLPDQVLLNEILAADMVITPHNVVRNLVNQISRKARARAESRDYSELPVVGDKIIFTSSIKEVVTTGVGAYQRVVVAKNTTAVIDHIYDVSVDGIDNNIVIDFTDENGKKFFKKNLALTDINGKKNYYKRPTFRYSYAITVHSSQGAQWENVLFLDGYWKNDAEKLRYVAITRASKNLIVLTEVQHKIDDANPMLNPLYRLNQQ